LTDTGPAGLIASAPWLEAGTRAVHKMRSEGEGAELTPDEVFGLEAIVMLTGRPAILIHDGRFFHPPEEWMHLEDCRDAIERTLRSVGRIEVTGHPSYSWVGTGFLVARDVVMTNRHVAEVFCQMGQRRKWRFKAGMAGRIDYVEEVGAAESAEFAFRSVIGIHDELDMALFRVRVTSDSGVTPPEPLPLVATYDEVQEGRQVYAVGYPAWDGRRNDPLDMLQIFVNVFNVKRLQPGEIRDVFDHRHILEHDCSTLGGNSGSCIIDLETNKVVGLHYGGRYMEGNYGVALWQITDDPLLTKAKVNFV
jgi:hypothetical protein